MRITILALGLVLLTGCASNMKNSMMLSPGDSKQTTLDHMGTPYDRSFSGDNEAWQYMEVVGYGQCEYMTVWFQGDKLHSVTSRRGSSIAGCGLGSKPVDWGQFKPHPIELDVTIADDR